MLDATIHTALTLNTVSISYRGNAQTVWSVIGDFSVVDPVVYERYAQCQATSLSVDQEH